MAMSEVAASMPPSRRRSAPTWNSVSASSVTPATSDDADHREDEEQGAKDRSDSHPVVREAVLDGGQRRGVDDSGALPGAGGGTHRRGAIGAAAPRPPAGCCIRRATV